MASKEKVITIKPKGISQKQWGTFLLELNIMKQQWRGYGVNVEIQAPGLKAVLFHGTRTNEQIAKSNKRSRK
jgi:hypothetical protein